MTLTRYSTGFALSLLLTLASFALVEAHLRSAHAYPSHQLLGIGIAMLAIIQLCVQVVFFLHLGKGSKARDTVMLCLAAAIIALFVGGSLWIMANLSDSHAVPFDGSISPQTETHDS